MDTNVAGKKVAILLYDYFEQDEFEEPLTALKDAGVGVTVVTASDDLEVFGMHHANLGDKFQADILLRDADPDDYDGLLLPGGVVNADALRTNGEAQDWAVDFLDSGKPVAAICHAPWLLVSADAVEGRRLTSYHTLEDDILNAGGEWVNQEVVVDDNLVTSRKPDDLPAFCNAFIELLANAQALALGDDINENEGEGASTIDEKIVEDDARLRSLGYVKGRDEITFNDEREILADDDDEDPDEFHPSDVVPQDEQDGNND
ncbi:MAG TPA: type 1 glutamine amidotransferase domain-containing protein [Candidatus Saccharimonadales bacterium]